MGAVAEATSELLEALLGEVELPVQIRWWDGSTSGRSDAATTLVVRSPVALQHLALAPGELGLARAYVSGELDIDGDIFDALELRDLLDKRNDYVSVRLSPRDRLHLLATLRRLGAVGRPPIPEEEVTLQGRLHSRTRDARAVSHHYDVGNRFYRLFLGSTMTYSCAYFEQPGMTLDEAQTAKYDLICRKLGLERGMRLLDVGCGWGGMVMHAAREHDVAAIGITLSKQQADLAEKRVAEAGLADRIEIRIQDYRDVSDAPFDAISSIGMFEHVGASQLGAYFGSLYRLLSPAGRLLNHAISRPPGRKAAFDNRSFVTRYVFPDGELQEVGSVVTAMQTNGFEVRDLESLREHYATTLRHWVSGLRSHWDSAVREVGEARARVWLLYMAGSALGFEAGRINIHQVLGVKTDEQGRSAMPRTRTLGVWERS